MTYLILRYTSLGNVAMTVPVIASVSARYPEHEFIVVTEKRLGDMFYGMPNVRHISTNETMPEADVLIDLQGGLSTLRARLQYRLGRKPVFHYHPTPGLTEHERYAAVFRQAGLESGDEFTTLPEREEAKAKVASLLNSNTHIKIGIAPFAKSRSNMLPYKVTKEIIAHYADMPHAQVFLFGAGTIECEMLRQWSSIYPRTTSVAGVLTLGEELELMRRLDVMICMDSANQHLSSLVGLRAISVWCATHPKNGFYGWKQNPQDCIQVDDLRCRPCTLHGTKRCRFRNFACQQISAEEVEKCVNE